MRKKLKKYTGGGTTPTGAFTAGAGFSGTGVGQGIGMFGGMAGNAINQLDQADGHMSAGGALAGGALKGASMGAALGPAGMLIGGGIGMIGGLMQRDKFNDEAARQEAAKREAERMRQNALKRSEYEQQQQILEQHPVAGNSTPRFAYGGPTGGGEKYHAIPNYGGSMDPNAQPSMDFYFQGQKMPAAEFIKQLPEGMNINQVAAYGIDQAQPMFDSQTGWSNVGVNDYMRSFTTSQGNTPTYEKGGPTGKLTQAMERDDSLMENVLEFFDPTGVTSYDDAYRAYQSMKAEGRSLPNFGEFVDMLGAVPVLGKVGKIGKAASAGMKMVQKASAGARAVSAGGKLLNMGDAANDIYSDNLGPRQTKTVQPKARYQPRMALGGLTMGPQYEAEGGEMIQYQQGDMPAVYGNGGITPVSSQEYEIKGPSHAQGGVDMSDEKGARIYSNKLTVDPELMAKLNSL